MRGRGTRKADHIGKQDFTMFDFVGVTDFHGDDEEDIAGGIMDARPTYDPDANPRNLLTLDVHDHIDPTTREWLTLDEDGRIVQTPEHEARAAEIGLRVEAWRGTQHFTAEQSRWAGLIGRRIMADAMHPEPFGDYDLDEHPFAALGGYDQARRVFGGEGPLGELIAGFNAQVLRPGTTTPPTPRGEVICRNEVPSLTDITRPLRGKSRKSVLAPDKGGPSEGRHSADAPAGRAPSAR